MFKKPYTMTFELDKDDEEDLKLLEIMHNRDKYVYKSMNDFLKAAVAAFDEPNPNIRYDESGREVLLNKIEALLDRKNEDLKSHFYRKTVDKFGA